MRGVETGELGGDRLTQDDRPGVPEKVDGNRSLIGHVVRVDLGAGGGGYSGDVIDVFDADGHAVQRAGGSATFQFFLPLLDVGQNGFPVDPDPGFQLGFQRVHPFQKRSRHFHRSDGPLADLADQFRRR